MYEVVQYIGLVTSGRLGARSCQRLGMPMSWMKVISRMMALATLPVERVAELGIHLLLQVQRGIEGVLHQAAGYIAERLDRDEINNFNQTALRPGRALASSTSLNVSRSCSIWRRITLVSADSDSPSIPPVSWITASRLTLVLPFAPGSNW